MVSIIVSTYQPEYLRNFRESVEKTIGTDYEIIEVQNNNKMGICKAYNIGATQATFPYLCFVHEDVEFKNQDWSIPLIQKFELDNTTGLIGIAGSSYKSASPSGWQNGNVTDLIHIIQNSKQKKDTHSNLSLDFEEAICLDGVFLFTKKEIWKKNNFDENNFKNFHCYDTDFSLNISLTYKVYVTKTVLLEHFSMGSYNKSWVDENIIFHNKWQTILPKGNTSKNIQISTEWNNKISFLLTMMNFNYSLLQLFKVYFKYGFVKFFSVYNAIKTLKVIVFVYNK